MNIRKGNEGRITRRNKKLFTEELKKLWFMEYGGAREIHYISINLQKTATIKQENQVFSLI